jgi:hypothetical protein
MLVLVGVVAVLFTLAQLRFAVNEANIPAATAPRSPVAETEPAPGDDVPAVEIRKTSDAELSVLDAEVRRPASEQIPAGDGTVKPVTDTPVTTEGPTEASDEAFDTPAPELGHHDSPAINVNSATRDECLPQYFLSGRGRQPKGNAAPVLEAQSPSPMAEAMPARRRRYLRELRATPAPAAALASDKKGTFGIFVRQPRAVPRTSAFERAWAPTTASSVFMYAGMHADVNVELLDPRYGEVLRTPEEYERYRNNNYWFVQSVIDLLPKYEWAVVADSGLVIADYATSLSKMVNELPDPEMFLIVRLTDELVRPGSQAKAQQHDDDDNGIANTGTSNNNASVAGATRRRPGVPRLDSSAFMIRNSALGFEFLQKWRDTPQSSPQDMIKLLNRFRCVDPELPDLSHERFYSATWFQSPLDYNLFQAAEDSSCSDKAINGAFFNAYRSHCSSIDLASRPYDVLNNLPM